MNDEHAVLEQMVEETFQALEAPHAVKISIGSTWISQKTLEKIQPGTALLLDQTPQDPAQITFSDDQTMSVHLGSIEGHYAIRRTD